MLGHMSLARYIRSTKAGGRTPATPPRIFARAIYLCGAQQRPGVEPRRHPAAAGRGRPFLAALNKGRGSNPGDTGSPRTCQQTPTAPLNKGRGSNPGDTRIVRQDAVITSAQQRPGVEPRRPRPIRMVSNSSSTKAGGRTPATRGASRGYGNGVHRSTKDGGQPRRHVAPHGVWQRRSTKAGGSNPGDTWRLTRVWQRRSPLNKGRGSNPGDTCCTSPTVALPTWTRSTKAGGRTPATHAARHRAWSS